MAGLLESKRMGLAVMFCNFNKTFFMGFAEKKEIIMEIVRNADEKLLGLILALANEYNYQEYQFSEEEIKKFEERRDKFYASGKKGFTVEESLNRLREKLI